MNFGLNSVSKVLVTQSGKTVKKKRRLEMN